MDVFVLMFFWEKFNNTFHQNTFAFHSVAMNTTQNVHRIRFFHRYGIWDKNIKVNICNVANDAFGER